MDSTWAENLHSLRKRQVEKLLIYFSQKLHCSTAEIQFNSGFIIGAGDGYQTSLLAPHFQHLISSDLNPSRLKLRVPGVEYIVCDADLLDIKGSFDVIFSDSVLEHLGNPSNFLEKSRGILRDDGYAIHIVPTRLMKFSYIVFHFPNIFLLLVERVWGLLKGKPFFRGKSISSENNLNSPIKSVNKSYLSRMLVPSIHGNYPSHWNEYSSWGRWEEMFQKSGYKIEARLKGVASSGYGFGFNHGRRLMETLGWSSLDIYILKKNI